jgi:L-ascorbate metabolism protein UlaG (beta-lactamase superfamily)
MVPVGGGGGLSASQAAELVAMLEPNLVIPMHFATPASRVDLTSVDKFLTEMGVTSIEAQDSLKISASSLPETTQVVLLNYKLQDAT